MNESTPTAQIDERSQSPLSAIATFFEGLSLWLREWFASVSGNGRAANWSQWIVGIAAILALGALAKVVYAPNSEPVQPPAYMTRADLDHAIQQATTLTDERLVSTLDAYRTKIDEQQAAIAELRTRVDTLSRAAGGKKPK